MTVHIDQHAGAGGEAGASRAPVRLLTQLLVAEIGGRVGRRDRRDRSEVVPVRPHLEHIVGHPGRSVAHGSAQRGQRQPVHLRRVVEVVGGPLRDDERHLRRLAGVDHPQPGAPTTQEDLRGLPMRREVHARGVAGGQSHAVDHEIRGLRHPVRHRRDRQLDSFPAVIVVPSDHGAGRVRSGHFRECHGDCGEPHVETIRCDLRRVAVPTKATDRRRLDGAWSPYVLNKESLCGCRSSPPSAIRRHQRSSRPRWCGAVR